MAVPKERLLARLKAYLTTKAINNLSNVRLDESSARLCSLPADDADDAAIDAVIANADVIFPFKDLASNDDRIRTLEAQTKKPETKTKEQIEAEEKAKKDAEELEAAKGKSDTPEYIKTLMATIEGLKSDIVEVKTGRVLETKQTLAKTAFEKSEKFKSLPETVKAEYLARIDLSSETPFEDQVAGLETNYDALIQYLANTTGHSGQPAGTGGTFKPDEKMLDDVVDSF